MKKLLFVLALFSANALATSVNINTVNAKTIAASLSGVGIKKADILLADAVAAKSAPVAKPALAANK